MNRQERRRAVEALEEVIDFGKRLARNHQDRMAVPSYDSLGAVVLTLFAAAHRNAGASADLLRSGWADEAGVLGRSVFEHVVYAHLFRSDDRQRQLFVHYAASLGRWDELDAYLSEFPDTDPALLAEPCDRVRQASLRVVVELGLLRGEDEDARRADLDALAADPEALYLRLREAYPKHQRRQVRAWSAKNLYRVAGEVDEARGTPTFLTLYRLLYVNASRVAHSDPATVGLVRGDDPRTLLLGPDPTMTVPVAAAIGQLLLGIDELVDDLFELGLQMTLSHAAAAFQASLHSH
jgi:Family of unknown function (DUF5677)